MVTQESCRRAVGIMCVRLWTSHLAHLQVTVLGGANRARERDSTDRSLRQTRRMATQQVKRGSILSTFQRSTSQFRPELGGGCGGSDRTKKR